MEIPEKLNMCNHEPKGDGDIKSVYLLPIEDPLEKYVYKKTRDFIEYKFPKNVRLDLASQRKRLLEIFHEVTVTWEPDEFECNFISYNTFVKCEYKAGAKYSDSEKALAEMLNLQPEFVKQNLKKIDLP